MVPVAAPIGAGHRDHKAVSRLGTCIVAHSPVLSDILANSPMTLRLSDTSLFPPAEVPQPETALRSRCGRERSERPQRERKAVDSCRVGVQRGNKRFQSGSS